MVTETISLPMERITALCREYRVRELAVFGSALREDFGPDSDIDLLVLFEPDADIGLIAYNALQRRLSAALGRPVDLVSKKWLNPIIRDEVLRSARVLYGKE
jgi:predicted nucleotidyltransferase